jgi:hypothetical protein
MFRWYYNATPCYVYLSDVSSATFNTNEASNLPQWELDFRIVDGSSVVGHFKSFLPQIQSNYFLENASDLGTKDL